MNSWKAKGKNFVFNCGIIDWKATGRVYDDDDDEDDDNMIIKLVGFVLVGFILVSFYTRKFLHS